MVEPCPRCKIGAFIEVRVWGFRFELSGGKKHGREGYVSWGLGNISCFVKVRCRERLVLRSAMRGRNFLVVLG